MKTIANSARRRHPSPRTISKRQMNPINSVHTRLGSLLLSLSIRSFRSFCSIYVNVKCVHPTYNICRLSSRTKRHSVTNDNFRKASRKKNISTTTEVYNTLYASHCRLIHLPTNFHNTNNVRSGARVCARVLMFSTKGMKRRIKQPIFPHKFFAVSFSHRLQPIPYTNLCNRNANNCFVIVFFLLKWKISKPHFHRDFFATKSSNCNRRAKFVENQFCSEYSRPIGLCSVYQPQRSLQQ